MINTMSTTTQPSKARRWISWIMSDLVIMFMLPDAIFKFFQFPEAIKGTLELGYAQHHLIPLGILGLVCTLLYAFPRTSILGAVLLTGYYGGAIATHLRVDNPLFSHLLFPVYLALLAWGGLWLRNENLRAIFPFITKS